MPSDQMPSYARPLAAWILSLIDRSLIVKRLGGHNTIPPSLIAHRVLSLAHSDSDSTDTPADDDVLTYDSASGKWRGEPSGAGAHNLLSATHGDTTAGGEDEGDSPVRRSGKWVSEAPIDISNDSANITAVNFADQVADVAAPGAGHTILYLLASGVARLRTATTIYSLLVNIMTALGDLVYGGASGAPTRLAGNTTTTRKFLTQTGDGAASAAPGWNTIAAADLPAMVGANGGAGTKGAVPAPAAGDAAAGKFLKADATWAVPAGGSLTVKEEDGNPSVSGVTEIKLTNGTLTDNGSGSVSVAIGAGSGSVAADTIWDAAGDLAVGSGANSATKLAMGSAHAVLRVKSDSSTLEWGPAAVSWSGTCSVVQSGAVAATINRANYYRVGPLCFVDVDITVTAAGTGGNEIGVDGLPAGAQIANADWKMIVGTGLIWDANGSAYACLVQVISTTKVYFQALSSTSGNVGKSPSFALANGDHITYVATYVAA